MSGGKTQKISRVIILSLLACASIVQADTIFVDTDAVGNNDGSSWDDAYNHLQDALAASSSGDEIRVAQGIYKPDLGAGITLGDRTATFQLINGVTLKGGYAGAGTPDPDSCDILLYETILSGDLNGNDGPNFTNNAENSYHVVTGGGFQAATVLDGFTITAGNGNRGGGIYEASGKISNCKITANSANAGGGLSECYAEMTNCIISHNRAIGSGGWISGGGMFNDGTTPTLINCIFVGNSALCDGGGMFSLDNHPTLINCTFSGNSAGGEGGGMLSTECWGTLINCTFIGNMAGENGGGITNHHDCDLTVYNCILWGNTDSGGTDETAQFYAYADRQNIGYSCIQGWTGSLGGTGNIGDDPLFVDTDGPDNLAGTEDDNLRLQPGSPCIDAGDPDYIAEQNETDLDGNPRVMDGRIDMGAYETPIFAEARILPRTINLASKGNWITCYIRLPDEYSVTDIEPNSISLEDEIKPEQFSVDEEQQVVMARFSRSEVQAILTVGRNKLTITGRLKNGYVFEGIDVITVIDKGSRN